MIGARIHSFSPAVGVAALLTLFPAAPVDGQSQRPGRFAGDGLVIGLEYAILNNARLVQNLSAAFAETGMPGMKHYVEIVEWGAMQSGPDAEIDFSTFDLFVAEYQRQGFTELTISLKPHSRWASVDVRPFGNSTNGSPKPEYRDHFQRWVSAVVERYDADGTDDMPGLRWPIRYVEIGNEFSSYQPEPVEEYLVTLELAYEAAHAAYPDVLVGHAAFLIAPVNMDVDSPAQYDTVWATTPRNDEHHGLEDIRAILDRPELFDIINIHNLGDPYEIEHIMRWLEYETGLRGYTKPVIISDTIPTSYIGWGAATTCRGPGLGLIGPPATEEDRCRLAEYFTRLVDGDRRTLEWTRGFVAADHVQRATIAAEQGIRVINLAFIADIPWLTTKLFRAGAGISAWAGAVRFNAFTGRVVERFAPYYAIGQIVAHLNAYDRIERIDAGHPRARVYRIERGNEVSFIAWQDPAGVVIPGDEPPPLDITFDTGASEVELEWTIVEPGVTQPTVERQRTQGGRISIGLIHRPVFLRAR